jgi:phosphoesterase RecJ-like protein
VNSKNSVKISFRSIGDFECNKFAENNFNGGGHSNAAGGKFEGNSNEAIKKFIKLLPNYKNNLK